MTPRTVGRYAIFDEIAHGGMATVHVGRLRGAAGFARTVAVKRLHPPYAKDPAFVSMLVDEARLAARVHHPNVVPVLDVVSEDGEVFLVMDYVVGETMSRLIMHAAAEQRRMPLEIAAAIMSGALQGLHAAHEARNEYGEPLDIVHRDVSPQNIMVGSDGITRVFDFGIAKAAQRSQTTHDGAIKGKIGYMSPEQLRGERIDRRCDIYASGVVLWEMLVGERLFLSSEGQPSLMLCLTQQVPPPSGRCPSLSALLDQLVLRAVERDPAARYQSALEMSQAIEACVTPATPMEVGAWVRELAAEPLATKARLVARIESMGELSLESTGASPQAAAMFAPPPVPYDDVTTDIEHADQLKGRRISRRLLVVTSAAIIVATSAVAVALLSRSSESQEPSAPLQQPSVATTNPPAAPTEPTSAGSSERASLAATSVAEDLAQPVPASTAKPEPRTPRRPPVATTSPPSACTPPYSIDENGHKRYKRECFR